MKRYSNLLIPFGDRQLYDFHRHGFDSLILQEQRFANVICNCLYKLEMHARRKCFASGKFQIHVILAG